MKCRIGENNMDALEILDEVCVENYDNGEIFTNRKRVDAIKTLTKCSSYDLIYDGALFQLYGKKDITADNEILIVSTHIDCHPCITKCYSSLSKEGILHGTYDNAITNAAALKVMMDGEISDNVFFAFTGDEEFRSNGAIALMEYLNKLNVRYRCIILDVTDMGWSEGASFTVENNFWNDSFGKCVVSAATQTGYKWKFVPSDLDDIPDYVDSMCLIREEAEADESWDYDENDIECFSLCLPCNGEMHSNEGVEVRPESYNKYIEVLNAFLKKLI